MSGELDVTRAEVCVAACADLFASDGEILASPMGLIPQLGAKLARLTGAPELLLSDGEATLLGPDGEPEGWLPFRQVFDVVAHGRRHVVMGANQVDRFGNQNISAIGPHDRPTRQLLGVRGAPGNTANHRTSYFVPRHSRRVFVDAVDVVSGVGYDRAGGLTFHDVHRVVTNLAVFDFDNPDRSIRLRSVHPGVDPEEVAARTSFPLVLDGVPATRVPTPGELDLIRTRLDPDGTREKVVPS
ncbi:CoA-transferase [Pseudonocardia eucalypti]|uniref:CoA-transferase n=1 Tax=Pseudonocardia eucalypti TaxID=648755 RepID=A0ABP9QYQ7_9PSEU|nr:acyl CoA:acetate/3-ketoacid CoA transferase beta subunit [Pseudonocardia eucalypti]